MKRLSSAATVALALAAGSALAADLPSYKSPPVPPAPIFTWTGFYGGFNHGFGGGVLDADVLVSSPALGPVATRTSNRASGFFAGGQAGYNYQFANGFVLGLETDLQWSDIRASHQATTGASTLFALGYVDIRNKLNWFGTTRARLGYSFGRLLPYVTGGVAYGEAEASGTRFTGGALFSGSAAETKVGWTAGAGVDYALSDSLFVRAEYLYLQLPSVGGPSIALLPAPFPALTGAFSTGSFGAHVVRTGLNMKFGGLNGLFTGGVLDLLTAAPTLDWSGFYGGVNGGYGGGSVDAVTTFAQPSLIIPGVAAIPGLATTTQTTNRTGGFIAGGQAGYNYQLTRHIVLGVETDGQWSDVKAWHQETTAGVLGLIFTDTKNAMNWFGTTRLRAGWASGDSLLYLSGGVAYGEVGASGTQFSGGLFAGSTSAVKVGWSAGAGAEYALGGNLSLNAEYLYVSLDGVGGPSFGIAPPPFPPFAGAFKTGTFGAHITRAGLNYHFNWGAAPVVAKY
jgi:outer membrane immunogenic protein